MGRRLSSILNLYSFTLRLMFVYILFTHAACHPSGDRALRVSSEPQNRLSGSRRSGSRLTRKKHVRTCRTAPRSRPIHPHAASAGMSRVRLAASARSSNLGAALPLTCGCNQHILTYIHLQDVSHSYTFYSRSSPQLQAAASSAHTLFSRKNSLENAADILQTNAYPFTALGGHLLRSCTNAYSSVCDIQTCAPLTGSDQFLPADA